MVEESIKYTCLFGGGAIRGAGHIGVIKALEELGIEIDTLGGSSVGSIVASLYAVGYSKEELADIFLSVNFELFRDISFGFKAKFALSKGEVFLDWIRDLIEKKYYGEKYIKSKNPPVTFKDINKNLVIMTTNMKDFSSCEFSNFETPDFEIAMAVRISCCMPGLMRAVNINEKLLVDGDLMRGFPMWSLSKNISATKNRILEVRLEGEFSGSDTNPLEYVNGMYSCITHAETDFIKKNYEKCDKYDYLVLNTGDVIVVDFNYPPEKRQKIIDTGYEITKNYFTKDLPLKKSKLLEIYLEILDYLRKTQQFLLRKKYVQSKNSVAELFIILSDVNRVIDTQIYSDIVMFQKLLFSNVKFGLLGYSRCENKDVIFSHLKNIIENLNYKVSELNRYITKYSV